MEIGRRTTRSIQIAKRKDNKLTGSCSSEKRRKILSGNQCIRICYRRSIITKTRWKMKTYCIFIKDNTTSGTKL